MPTSSPDQPALPKPPVGSVAGSSPLMDRIDSETTEIHITPAFGGRLHVAFIGSHTMPEVAVGALEAVTIHGDGRIEYHSNAVEGGAR